MCIGTKWIGTKCIVMYNCQPIIVESLSSFLLQTLRVLLYNKIMTIIHGIYVFKEWDWSVSPGSNG